MFGKETLGEIRSTGGVGPFASLGGYEFVVDGKTYFGSQQKMFRERPIVQYLSGDPATNRVKHVGLFAFNWFVAFLSIFGGGLLSLIGGAQTYVFFRLRK